MEAFWGGGGYLKYPWGCRSDPDPQGHSQIVKIALYFILEVLDAGAY